MAEETTEEVKAPEASGHKTIVIILASVIALLIIAIVVLFFTPFGKKLLGGEEKAKQHEEKEHVEEKMDPTKIEFINIPEILITLRSKDGKGGFLKASFVIQVSSKEVAQKIDKLKPVILDQMQTYLRELDIEDMRGSAGLQRIRQDLIARVNNVLAPEKIMAILIRDFILQ